MVSKLSKKTKFVYCPICGKGCYKDIYDIFGCSHCQRKSYEEMRFQKMDVGRGEKNPID